MSRVTVNTLIDRSTRNMGAVHSVVKESTIELIKRAYKEGINVQISSGFRSYAQQNDLYAKGRTKSGSIVTNARGGYSNHNFGLAVDYFLTTEDGNTAVWTVNSKWKRVAKIGKSLGFTWGGDWKSFKDYPHLEMTGGLSTAQLRAGKRPTLKSKVSGSTSTPSINKPSSGRRTLYVKEHKMNGNDVLEVQKALAKKYFYPEKGAKNNGVDGWYGPKTADAVKRFQIMNGLEADGVVGKNTYSKLGLK